MESGALTLPKNDKHLYQLEDEFTGASVHHTATRRTLELLTSEVCTYYGINEPALRFINTRRNQHSAWYDHEIVLNRARDGANGWTLLHELAHVIMEEFYLGEVEHHGPEFVAVYMHLLDRWNYLPNTCFRLLAKKYRVKIGRRYRPRAFNK